MLKRSSTLCLPLALLISACSEAVPAPEAAAWASVAARPAPAPGSIAGVSKTLTIAGAYTPISLDRVARVAIEDGRLVVHGSSTNVSLDLPAGADASRVTRHWALVTESYLESGRRSLTFTHSELLDDFTIELPESEGPVRYGGFERQDGGEVLVFAWGESSASYWGWVTIARPAPAR